MTTIRYKVVTTNLLKGEKPLGRYVVLHNGSVGEDTVYAGVATKTGMPQPLVKATGALIFDSIADCLGHGYRVELDQASAFLSLPGKVESLSAESRQAAPPVLVAHLTAKGAFKKCCQGPDFVLENVTQGASVGINGVIDGISQTENVLTNGTDVEVHATGYGLYMPDLGDPTVGAFLSDTNGAVLVQATVTESTATTLVCVFPQIDLEPGTYRFCVASRNGLDPTKYAVTIGRRNVQVVAAPETDSEEGQNG